MCGGWKSASPDMLLRNNFPCPFANYKKCSIFAADFNNQKKHQLWLTKFLTNVLLAVLVWINAPSVLSPKAPSTKSIPMSASNVALALVLAPAKLSLWMNNL